MKIFIGGATANQKRVIRGTFPDVEFVFCKVDESAALWGSSVGNSDACVVMTNLMNHKQLNTLKSKTKAKIHCIRGGVSSLVKEIDGIIYGEENAINIG